MLYRVGLAVDVEAESLTQASNAAAAPVEKDIADRLRRAGFTSENAHVTRCEVVTVGRL